MVELFCGFSKLICFLVEENTSEIKDEEAKESKVDTGSATEEKVTADETSTIKGTINGCLEKKMKVQAKKV